MPPPDVPLMTAPPSLASLIGRLAARVGSLGAGPRAELRRLHPDASDRWRAETFYRLYAEVIAPEGAGGDLHERRWAILLAGLAGLEHAPGSALGRVLAESGFAPARFTRLLDADDDHLPDQIRAVVSYLGSKGQTVNWTEVAHLLLDGDRDAVRRRIASTYYRFSKA